MNAAHQHVSVPHDLPTHGVLVWLGTDNMGVAAKAAHVLRKGMKPNRKTDGNITAAWIRSFGPFGVVMYRFETRTSSAMRALRTTYKHKKDFPVSLMPELAKHPNSWDHKSPSFPGLMIHRAPEPWASRQDIPGLVCWITVPFGKDSRRQGSLLDIERARSDDIARFLNILATLPRIDVAQFDQIRARHGLLYCMRIFDLGKRGTRWLSSQLRQAIEDASDVDLAPLSIQWIDDRAAPENPEFSRQLNDYILGQDYAVKDDRNRYLYLAVHCADRPGLFASIYDFLRTHPGSHGGKRKDRTIVRSCCRGLGDEGISLVAALREDTDKPEYLQSELRHMLKRGDSEARKAGLVHSSSQPLDDDWRGYWTANVVESPIWPWDLGNQRQSQRVLAAKDIHPFRLDPDRVGFLADLCDCPNGTRGEDRANIYFLDGRADYTRSGNGEPSAFVYYLGLGVGTEDAKIVEQRMAKFMRKERVTQLDRSHIPSSL